MYVVEEMVIDGVRPELDLLKELANKMQGMSVEERVSLLKRLVSKAEKYIRKGKVK